MNFIGDFLVSFNCEKQPEKKRIPTQPWIRIKEEGTWNLSIQEADHSWKGFPFLSFQYGNLEIFLLGEIFGLPRHANSLKDLVTRIALGSGQASELNGHCLLLAWNTCTHCWHIWTNRFGSLHIYHAFDGKEAALGTYFLSTAYLASKRQLDWFGLAGLFNFGFFPQDRTFFDDVRILQPASEYIFDENGSIIQRNRYWNWQHRPDPRRSYNETISEFSAIFREIVADQSRDGRIALPISGGLDSRTIASALDFDFSSQDNHASIWAYSYGYTEASAETQIARQIAAKRNFKFESFTIKPYLFDHLDMVMSCLEGFNDITMSRQAGIVGKISQHADAILGGHLGDLVLDDAGLADKQPGSMSSNDLQNYALHKIYKKGRTWLTQHLLKPQIDDGQIENLLQEFTRQELETLEYIDDYDFRIKAFKIEQYCFRFTATGFRMFQPAAYIRLPFYDTRLVDLMCTVPTKFVQNRRLQIDFLKRTSPDLSRINWQVYDADLYTYQHFNTWLLPKRALKKAWRMLMRKKVIERNWEVQFLCPQGKSGLQRWLLQPGLRLHEFVSPAAIQELLRTFYTSPQPDHGHTVSMLLTLSTWLELHV